MNKIIISAAMAAVLIMVVMITMCGQSKPDISLMPPPKPTLASICAEYNVPLLIAVEVIQHESGGDPLMKSGPNKNRTFDYGLFGLNSDSLVWFKIHYHLPSTWRWYNVLDNTYVGVRYLADLRAEFGNWYQALVAYNCGSDKVRRGKEPEASKVYAANILENLLE